MWLSARGTPFTVRIPSRTLRPLLNKEGHKRVYGRFSSSNSASATGPMFPCGVESKVEQYLKYRRSAPWAFNQRTASSDSATASAAGSDRLFRATTTAWQFAGMKASWQGQISSRVFSPPAVRNEAASPAPVKSSAMQPIVRCRVDSAIGYSFDEKKKAGRACRPAAVKRSQAQS